MVCVLALYVWSLRHPPIQRVSEVEARFNHPQNGMANEFRRQRDRLLRQ